MKTESTQKGIPKGWTIKKIKDVLSFEQPNDYIVGSTAYRSTAKTPVLTANKSFILGYTDEDFGIYENTPAIIFDDFTTDSKYVDFPFKIKSSAIKILKTRDASSDLKFVFEIMKAINFPIESHKRHYISQYQEQDIVIPLISEQKRIAAILSSLDEEIEKTDALISETEKLKKALTHNLFTKGVSHKKFKKTKSGLIPEEWEQKTLEDVALFENGKAHENHISVDGEYTLVNSKFISMDGKVFKKTDHNLKPLLKDDIALVMSDIPNGKAIGKCLLIPENNKYTLNQRIGLIRAKKSVLPQYLFLFLNRNKYFLSFDNGVGQTNMRKNEVLACPILVPPIEEQKKIADILLSVGQKIAMSKELKLRLGVLKKGLMSDLLSGKVRTI